MGLADPSAVASDAGPRLVYRSGAKPPGLFRFLSDFWSYRGLLYFLVLRDTKARFRGTRLGVLWAILQPILTLVVFSVFFRIIVRVPSDGLPYPVFAYSGLVLWQLFSNGLNEAARSFFANENLVTRIYFPRLVLPVTAALSGVSYFLPGVAVLLVVATYYHVQLHWSVVFMPFLGLFAVYCAIAVGIWLAALSVRVPDLRHIIPSLLQFWLFATPIAYSARLIPDRFRVVYDLNPMALAVMGSRSLLAGTPFPYGPEEILLVVGGTTLLLWLGLLYFQRIERTMADYL